MPLIMCEDKASIKGDININNNNDHVDGMYDGHNHNKKYNMIRYLVILRKSKMFVDTLVNVWPGMMWLSEIIIANQVGHLHKHQL